MNLKPFNHFKFILKFLILNSKLNKSPQFGINTNVFISIKTGVNLQRFEVEVIIHLFRVEPAILRHN